MPLNATKLLFTTLSNPPKHSKLLKLCIFYLFFTNRPTNQKSPEKTGLRICLHISCLKVTFKAGLPAPWKSSVFCQPNWLSPLLFFRSLSCFHPPQCGSTFQPKPVKAPLPQPAERTDSTVGTQVKDPDVRIKTDTSLVSFGISEAALAALA